MSSRGAGARRKAAGRAARRAAGRPRRHGGVASDRPPGGRPRSDASCLAADVRQHVRQAAAADPAVPAQHHHAGHVVGRPRRRQVERDGRADVRAPGLEAVAALQPAPGQHPDRRARAPVGAGLAVRHPASRCALSCCHDGPRDAVMRWSPERRAPSGERTRPSTGRAVTLVTRAGASGRRRVHSTSAAATPAAAERPTPEYPTDEGKRHPPRPRAHHRRPAVPGHGLPAPHPGQPARVRPGPPAEPDQRQHLRHPAQRHRVRGGCAARHQGHAGDVSRRQRHPRHGRRVLRPVHAGRRGHRRPGPVDGAGHDLPGRVAQRPPDRDPCCRPRRSSRWSRRRRS